MTTEMSAAKLVSDDDVRCAAQAYHAHCASVGHYDPGAMRAALESFAVAFIGRHATPQTQATHGEGEAVDHFDLLSEEQITACRGLLVYYLGGSQQNWTIGEHNEAGGYGIPLTQIESGFSNPTKNFVISKILEICRPAPSPTAAPALGELVRKLEFWIEEEEKGRGETMLTADLREAVAALSGVAAQGDGEARVSEESKFTEVINSTLPSAL